MWERVGWCVRTRWRHPLQEVDLLRWLALGAGERGAPLSQPAGSGAERACEKWRQRSLSGCCDLRPRVRTQCVRSKTATLSLSASRATASLKKVIGAPLSSNSAPGALRGCERGERMALSLCR